MSFYGGWVIMISGIKEPPGLLLKAFQLSLVYLISVLLCWTVKPVEEVLIVWQTVIRDKLHDLLMWLNLEGKGLKI